MKGGFLFSFGHCCSSQHNCQKSHFACTLLYKQIWYSWYIVLTFEGSATHTYSPGELKDEDHSPDKPWRLSPKRFAVLNGDGEWGREKEGAPRRKSHLCWAAHSCQVHKFCGQGRVVWQFQLLLIGQLAQAWPLSWNAGWVLCSIAFLCHRQYLCSWRVHYFFNKKEDFWRILSYIFEKNNR